MNLIYSCVFFNSEYLELLKLLLQSFKLYSNLTNYDYLIITEERFKNTIQTLFNNNNINGKIWCLTADSQLESCYTRLKIFNYPEMNKYDKLLYLDTDILIIDDLNKITTLNISNKLYCFNEGEKVSSWGHGKLLFKKYKVKINYDIDMFSTCVMLFLNCDIIKNLFEKVLKHINDMFPNPKLYNLKSSFEQDFIIYHSYIDNIYDNELITKFVRNSNMDMVYDGNIITHFCIPCGDTKGKYCRMKSWLEYVNKIKN